MDKSLCLIQARSNNTRLPGKAYLPFGDSDIMDTIVEAVSQSDLIDEYFVVIPLRDWNLQRRLVLHEANVFMGSEEDVLDRFYQCAKLVQPDHIVRITGDCPLLTENVIDETILEHLRAHGSYGIQYTANRLEEPMYPDGFDVEMFTFNALEDAANNLSLSKEDREHVTPYIKRHYKCHAIHCHPLLLPFKDIKLSVDTREDYERVVKWYNENNGWYL
jgi:spore coat polysaccharide biosynthesis protein SpsF (cytidylyltransferase family)